MASPNWLDLPRELTAMILHKLGTVDMMKTAPQVCSLWRGICDDPFIWRIIDMSNSSYSHTYILKSHLTMICRHAINRSCGHLLDINLGTFATDALFNHTANCASLLRRLRLVGCWQITDKGLSEGVKNLPLLEEIDISFTYLTRDSLEAIGRSCPVLKSLKFKQIPNYEEEASDEEAFAIANTMSELVNLQLCGNGLSNDGLLAIVDGCTLLESLDLRVCQYIDLRGSLGKRCAEQITHLRLPDDEESHDYGQGHGARKVGGGFISDSDDENYTT